MQTLFLNKDQERRLLAGHLWIYSNEIDAKRSPLKQFQAGELVKIIAASGRMLGVGYINPNCLLCVRLLSKEDVQIDEAFFKERIQKAIALRERLFPLPFYRAVYGESDGLPGLVIDRYDDVWVLQANTAGVDQRINFVIDALIKLMPVKTIMLCNDSSQRKLEGLEQYRKIIYGEELDHCRILENECNFLAPLMTGQKTAWFYDHRANRRMISQLSKNKVVLDVFSYLGAFTLPCAKQGAKHVIAIDASAAAVEQLLANAKNNSLHQVEGIKEDAFVALQNFINDKEKFDVIILDPPALIKKKKDFNAGLQAYQKLNELALQVLNPEGLLFSASCSMHLSGEDLRSIIRKAALRQKKNIKILKYCHQDYDHPIHPTILETEYLKGFLITLD
ncbi:MAG: hypothetical protein A3E87_00515 [Gammaproteobacteria bacterium RIFCSPHIGHO2_12_FULL_35_23]|nr:MAG: hypothetical protein A3E87_00515 [Gammaproteobacteria bacterium RIFCSPHIGHO2_12_FULL_35_23]